MKKTTLAIIALFLVLFTVAGVFSASATSDGAATTTTNDYYCSTIPASSTDIYSTTVPDYSYFCVDCNKGFESEEALINHFPCTGETSDNSSNNDIRSILETIIDLVKSETSQWSDIENIIVRIIDLIENVENGTVTKDDFDDAVADLEAVLADIDSEKKDELIDALKKKIEEMYAGEDATTTYPFATGTDTDSDCDCECECTCPESLWDIIGGWLAKIADFFRKLFEIVC